MTEQDPEPRQFVGIRLRPATITGVDRIAAETGTSRSEVLRLAFTKGLAEAEAELRGEKPMSASVGDRDTCAKCGRRLWYRLSGTTARSEPINSWCSRRGAGVNPSICPVDQRYHVPARAYTSQPTR